MPVPRSEIIERSSLRDVSRDRLKAAILDGTFEPGERLHDAELMEWLGVSRTPLREAINDLVRMGLVETEAQRFTRVVSPDLPRTPEVITTLGAVLSGISRDVAVSADAEAREALARRVAPAVDAAERKDSAAMEAAVADLFTAMVASAPTELLRRATADTVDALLYKYAIAPLPLELEVDWANVESRLRRLAAALRAGHGVEAQLSVSVLLQVAERAEN
ncbi:MAG: GntR family transcriptional regulator [Actinobacteria bacterium]|nr:GntR family transcriptional regulator [Actinomycetota bacterium]